MTTCPQLEASRQNVTLSTLLAVLDTEVDVSCYEGFHFQTGVFVITLVCMEDQQWNGTIPPCVGKERKTNLGDPSILLSSIKIAQPESVN